VRRLFLIALLALLAGAVIVQLVRGEAGYILVAYGEYTVEATFWAGVLALLALFLSAYVMLRGLIALLRMPRRVASAWRGYRQRKDAAAFDQGLLAYLQGDYVGSRKRLAATTRRRDASLLHYLVAARASTALGEGDAARQLLDRAPAESAQALAVAVVKARSLLDDGKEAEASEVLLRAPADARKHPQALIVLVEAARAQQQWEDVLALLPDVRRRRALSESEQRTLALEAYAGLLHGFAESGANATDLTSQWRRIPARLRKEPTVLVVYARALAAAGAGDTAAAVLLRVLRRRWDPLLMRAYSQLPHPEPERALQQSERWLSRHGEKPALLLGLGRLAAQAGQMERAQALLEGALKMDPSAENYAELGRLLEARGDVAAALACYRQGVLSSAPALPGLAAPVEPLIAAD
jgi:HemY protein